MLYWRNRTEIWFKRYQHEYDIKTKKKKDGFGDHMRENKQHLVDWNNRTFLEIDKDWRSRKIKEALYKT